MTSLHFLLLLASAVAVAASTVYSNDETCDSCRTLTEQFHRGWEEVVKKQAGDGRAEQKSDAPPVIVYNQDIEDYLQGFCDSSRITGFRDYIRKGCKKVMDKHKREVVAKYLSVSEIVGSSMKTTRVPLRSREVCSGLTQECKLVPKGYDASAPVKVSKCLACQRTIRDAQYVLRRSIKYADKLKNLDAFEHLETLCPDVYKRYDDDPDSVFSVCETLMDEYEDEVLTAIAKKDPQAVKKICVDVTDWCSPSDLV